MKRRLGSQSNTICIARQLVLLYAQSQKSSTETRLCKMSYKPPGIIRQVEARSFMEGRPAAPQGLVS
jgi:hypothetical protein